MRPILLLFLLMTALVVRAQSANTDALYEESKKLYDEKKYSLAIKKLLPAAQKGHKKAQYRMGRCYDTGHGVAENNTIAFSWYMKAAAQNHAKSQYQVGRCYKKGKGVKKDRVKAFKYFTLSANKGYAKAKFALGECYFEGKGTTKNLSKAKSLFLQAINDKKDGAEVLQDLRDDAAKGEEDAIAIRKFLGK